MLKTNLVTLRNNIQKKLVFQIVVGLSPLGTGIQGVWTFHSACALQRTGDRQKVTGTKNKNIGMFAMHASMITTISQIWINHLFS